MLISQIQDLLEAKVGAGRISSATNKAIDYLEKKLGYKLYFIGTEIFSNTLGSGKGLRFVAANGMSVRFNWESSGEIVSVDVWLGNKRDPNLHVTFKGTSFAKALPTLAQVLEKPKVGDYALVAEGISIFEVKKGTWTGATAIADMLKKLEAGKSMNRSEFIFNYHPENAEAFDAWVEANKNRLVIDKRRISLKSTGASSDVGVQVRAGGSNEKYEDDNQEDERVKFSDQLEHLESLTKALIAGSFNALLVAGAGGTGKTQTVEDTLHSAGLQDENGYTKITGSASPIGMYLALYKNRKGIVLFDDCDGALESQDGRNIIKAATDTKKIRKLAWAKKSAYIDGSLSGSTSQEDGDALDADAEDSYEEKAPPSFNFEGRIIFISNLPLNKLDPDGALRTRAFIINIDPTKSEMIEAMQERLPKFRIEAGQLSLNERQEVLDLISASKRIKNPSFRTLVRALGLRASGVPNWADLVQAYA